MRFSANLGFLWAGLPMPEAIARAANAGFAAVEAHWPYSEDPAAVKAALEAAGLPLLGVNTLPGDRAAGEFGLFALPGRGEDAMASFEPALDFAVATGARMIHAMAGKAEGPAAMTTLVANLREATRRAAPHGIKVLIEPINQRDAPGYFLSDLDQAAAIVETVGADNLAILFDCYHMQISGGDLLSRFRSHLPMIGHVQFAAVPDRGEPDRGEVDYRWMLPELQAAGYQGFFGAEYRPRGDIEAGFGWLDAYGAAKA